MHRKRRNRNKILLGVVIAIAAIVAFGLILRAIDRSSMKEESGLGDSGDWGKMATEDHYITIGDKDYKYTDELHTYLIIGTDSGSGTSANTDSSEEYFGEMADFLTLLVVNKTRETYGFMQLDRDTITDVPMLEDGEFTGTYQEQICIAHWYGRNKEESNQNTVDAVSNLFGGLPIDGYYTINMNDVGAVNHAIGGVVVDIDTDMANVDPDFKEGATVLLSDDQAQKFVRARMSVGEGTNKERMSRQRQYMQKAFNLVISQLRENPNYINDLYDELEQKIDSELPSSEVSRIANRVRLDKSQGFLTFSGSTTSGDTLGDGEQHTEFHMDEESLLSNLQKVIALEEGTRPEEETAGQAGE